MGGSLTMDDVRLLSNWFSCDKPHLVPVIVHREGFLLYDSTSSGLDCRYLALRLDVGINRS